MNDFLKRNWATKDLYSILKKKKDARLEKIKFDTEYIFDNRSQGLEKVCIVLAGYKEFVYESVFGRLKKYIDADIDVCIITSGLMSEVIRGMCEKNSWSYLSTKVNNVSLVQNLAIKLHPNAKWIYKLDEDIFITKNYFGKMFNAFQHAIKSEYCPGVIAPIIPLNGYGHVRVLEKLELKGIYEEKFGNVKYASIPSRKIQSDPEVAKFFWGEGNYIPTVDSMNEMFGQEKLEERACPIRFSIGAILFNRSLWEKMGCFSVNPKYAALGLDEEQLCAFCMKLSLPVMVSENIVVGHLSFGPQNVIMKDYYLSNKDLFMCK